MSKKVIVDKGRTVIITVSLGVDVSGDTITSEIRTLSGTLILEWDVTFDSDGTDGELILRLDDTDTATVTHPSGIMDLKRQSAGEPYSVFDKPLEVEFREVVTA